MNTFVSFSSLSSNLYTQCILFFFSEKKEKQITHMLRRGSDKKEKERGDIHG
jgi:hypothetical protein